MRAGFSLFEVLVAIGILVAIAAIALPWAWSRLSARDLPESAETLTAILMLARAEAMSSGRLVEVRIRRGDSDPFIEVRSTFLDPDRLSLGEPSDSGLEEAFGLEDAFGERDRSVQPIGATWAFRRLPTGIGLRPIGSGPRAEFDGEETDAALEFAGADLIEALDEEPIAIDAGPIDRPIAIFLPDGSNMLAGSWWLEEMPADGLLPAPEDDDRRRLRLSLGDPSGVPRWGEIERVVPRGTGLAGESNTEFPREPAEATDPARRDRSAERRSDRTDRNEIDRASESEPERRDERVDPDDEEATP